MTANTTTANPFNILDFSFFSGLTLFGTPPNGVADALVHLVGEPLQLLGGKTIPSDRLFEKDSRGLLDDVVGAPKAGIGFNLRDGGSGLPR